MPEFYDANYRTQTTRLRSMALSALEQYAITSERVTLIDHGENTTFDVRAAEGRFLLRIMRPGYHTFEGAQCEMRWLRALRSDTDIVAPFPVASRRGEDIVRVEHEIVPEPRNCCLFEWVEGRFVWKGTRTVHARRIGGLLARLQRHSASIEPPGPERISWDIAGLTGLKGAWGSMSDLTHATPTELADLKSAAAALQARFAGTHNDPTRFGWIHADLHGGNVLHAGDDVCPIDFDDCGLGYYGYDLAVASMSMARISDAARLEEALVEGYLESGGSSAAVVDMKPLKTARCIVQAMWVATRHDNPSIRKGLNGSLQRALSAARAM